MCEKWLTFDNKLVLEILVEACRPRTREQCAKEFKTFLSIAIPQKFKVNADNFLQSDFVPRHQYAPPSPFPADRNQSTRYQPTKPSLAVLNTDPTNSYQDNEDDDNSIYEHFEDNEEDLR